MQTARSPLASVVIISFDALSSVLSLRSIYQSTRTVQKLLLNQAQPQLIAEVKLACQNPRVSFETSGLRVRSPLRLRLSIDSQRALAKVTAFGKTEDSTTKSSRATRDKEYVVDLGKLRLPFCQRRIAPTRLQTSMAIIPVAPTAPSPDQRIPSFEDQLLLVRESAQLMFHCEYIVLIEYVECVIPMVYGLYLQALFRLGAPLGFSIVHQLAFVLETHAMQVQGRMFVWTAFILTFTLAHFGSDFTFRFEWMRDETS
ncbi:hypothetical protein PF005_g27423 [Phytophthora fragariae]|nr:hypothetical protein PF009_g28003 [Phytophthora fragariae]KAE9067909.1 hypothetical protein PF010_g27281 [Phytophthora fragariae]KAE9069253.1 hypothetical protein PF007_g27391 [Phytophthora fragariae]KAE9080514.1 hypothetical protein PF006_g27299 [Phytophthora fragariae]KAE9170775.1 hypothetical protein PF005_g27423 [Phytophthora fragariae]